MSGRAVTCRYHCSGCRGHFSSLNAFDAHRAGDHGAGRHCLEPLDDDRFATVASDGRCDMYAVSKVGLAIWTLAADLQRARQRSGGSPLALFGVAMDREVA